MRGSRERCTHEILNAIRSGNLHPGQRLSEGAMSKKLGVGRAAVRVAFDRLAWAGLLERVSRSGTYVRRISLTDYDEVMELRAGLEAMAAARACSRMRAGKIASLYRIADRLDKLGAQVDRRSQSTPRAMDKDYAELEELEARFHRGIVQASATRHILPILDNYHLLERTFLVGMSFPEGNVSKIRREPQHRDIAIALRRRDPELAKRAVERHYRLLRANLMSRFARSALIEADRSAPGRAGRLRRRLW